MHTKMLFTSLYLIFLSQFYINNTFGLKTLDEKGRIHFHVVPGVDHYGFPDSKDVFECCIKPYLD